MVGRLILTDNTLTWTTKARAKFTRLDVGGVLDSSALPDVVFNHVPVTLLQLSVVRVRGERIWLMHPRKLQKLGKCAPFIVLHEGFALGEVLEDLVAGR